MPRGARTDSRADAAIAIACAAVALLLLILPDGARERTASVIRGTVVAPLAAMQERAALGRRAFVDYDSLVRVADTIVRRSQQLDEVARERGDRTVSLVTAEMMLHLVRLYGSHGFEIAHRGPPDHGKDAHMRVRMVKRL